MDNRAILHALAPAKLGLAIVFFDDLSKRRGLPASGVVTRQMRPG
jgi:hypothetical protein